MTGIKKAEPLHLQSYRIIKEEIISGNYSVEKRITELGLSKELGVSRGTIREALKMLIQDGLLTQKDGHISIFKPTLQVAEDLYLCREKLESLAAKLAAKHITEEEKEELVSIIKQSKAIFEKNDQLEMSLINAKFHERIIDYSRNQELLQIMNVLSSKIQCVRNSVHWNYVRADNFIVEHEMIASAIILQKEEEAELAMSQHIKNDLKAIYKLFE